MGSEADQRVALTVRRPAPLRAKPTLAELPQLADGLLKSVHMVDALIPSSCGALLLGRVPPAS